MNYQIKKCIDSNHWDDFILSTPQNNLFCQTAFLDACRQDYDLMFITKGDLILLGVVIIKNNDRTPIKNQFMYQGVLFSKYFELLSLHKKIKMQLDVIQFLLIKLESIYGHIDLSLHHSIGDLRGFQWHNYHNKNGLQPSLNLNYTGILDLSEIENFDEILMNSRTVRRQEYKKCVKNGFTVEESDDINILNLLHNKTFERQGITRSESEVFLTTTLAKKSISKGFGRLLICRDEKGIPASASLFIFDDNTGYYLIGANDPDYRKFGTGGFVVLEQIRYCIEQGLSYVDFMGINSPFRGDFKTSLNAAPRAYFSFQLQ